MLRLPLGHLYTESDCMLLLDSAVFDAVIDWLANGIMGFSGWQIFFVILGLTHITIASVTIFLHRHQAHPPNASWQFH